MEARLTSMTSTTTSHNAPGDRFKRRSVDVVDAPKATSHKATLRSLGLAPPAPRAPCADPPSAQGSRSVSRLPRRPSGPARPHTLSEEHLYDFKGGSLRSPPRPAPRAAGARQLASSPALPAPRTTTDLAARRDRHHRPSGQARALRRCRCCPRARPLRTRHAAPDPVPAPSRTRPLRPAARPAQASICLASASRCGRRKHSNSRCSNDGGTRESKNATS